MLPALSAPVFATDSVGLGHRFFNGMVVGTVVGPPELPNGGAWAFTAVRFNPGVTPYLLTSSGPGMDAASRGDVVVTRIPGKDFRCPVTQP